MATGNNVYIAFSSIDQSDSENQSLYDLMLYDLKNGSNEILNESTENPPLLGYKIKATNIDKTKSTCDLQLIFVNPVTKKETEVASIRLDINNKKAKTYSFAPEYPIMIHCGILELDPEQVDETQKKIQKALGDESINLVPMDEMEK